MPPVNTIQKKASPRALTHPGSEICAAVISAEAVIIQDNPMTSMAAHAAATIPDMASASIASP